ncbi:MAG TPA: hypothetical protein VGF48_08060 [Thermoanaerobaculia bacterium]
MIRIALALTVTQLLACAALAQSAAEFGRASGGEISVITKQPRRLSGSLGFSQSSGGRGQGYNATLGGSVLDERLWFFASAATLPAMQYGASNFQAVDAKMTAQPVDWSTITASFTQAQPVMAISPLTPEASLPSSFLSLRSTTMLSDSMMMNFSFSTRKAGQP